MKGIKKVYDKDDPIFSSGPQTFVPVSRPSTPTSSAATDGTTPTQDPWPIQDEMREQYSIQRRMEEALDKLHPAKASTSAPSSAPNSKGDTTDEG